MELCGPYVYTKKYSWCGRLVWKVSICIEAFFAGLPAFGVRILSSKDGCFQHFDLRNHTWARQVRSRVGTAIYTKAYKHNMLFQTANNIVFSSMLEIEIKKADRYYVVERSGLKSEYMT